MYVLKVTETDGNELVVPLPSVTTHEGALAAFEETYPRFDTDRVQSVEMVEQLDDKEIVVYTVDLAFERVTQ